CCRGSEPARGPGSLARAAEEPGGGPRAPGRARASTFRLPLGSLQPLARVPGQGDQQRLGTLSKVARGTRGEWKPYQFGERDRNTERHVASERLVNGGVGDRCLRAENRIARIGRRAAALVYRRHRRVVEEPVAGLTEPGAQVDVLAVHEEPLVEAADLREGR